MTVNQTEKLHQDKDSAVPIYLVVDTSWSMNDDGKIDAANEIMPTVIRTCLSEPMVDQAARFCLIEFNADAHVLVPLAKGSSVQAPTLTPRGGTSYTKAFQLLRKQLEDDYQTLKLDGFTLYRPFVVFITDGEPICDDAARAAAIAELSNEDFKRRPNMMVFGVGSTVSTGTLQRYTVGRGTALTTREGSRAADALASMVKTLMQSVVSSTLDGSAGDEGPQIDPTDFIENDPFILELD